MKLISFCKSFGYKQLIDTITRPNKKGGSAIDLIMTNSVYDSQSGICVDILSDYYTACAIREKQGNIR